MVHFFLVWSQSMKIAPRKNFVRHFKKFTNERKQSKPDDAVNLRAGNFENVGQSESESDSYPKMLFRISQVFTCPNLSEI